MSNKTVGLVVVAIMIVLIAMQGGAGVASSDSGNDSGVCNWDHYYESHYDYPENTLVCDRELHL